MPAASRAGALAPSREREGIVHRDADDLVHALAAERVGRADEAWNVRRGAGAGEGAGQREDHDFPAGQPRREIDRFGPVLTHRDK